MKKIKQLLFVLLLMLNITLLNAQSDSKQENPNLDPALVPTITTNAFTIAHPGVTAVWKADGENFKASYNDPESKLGRIIVYDKSGKVVRMDNEIDNISYPSAITDFYSKNYPGEKYQVWSAEDKQTGEKKYYSGRNMETIWFDQNGNRVKGSK